MPETLIPELVDGFLGHARQLVERAARGWPDNGEASSESARREKKAREIAVLAGQIVPFRAFLRDYWQDLFDQMKTAVVDYRALGEHIHGLWTDCADLLNITHALCLKAEAATGKPLPVTGRTAEACEDVLRMRDGILENWPWPPTSQEVQHAKDVWARGEGVDAEVAFAEDAGISVEELRRRMAEHKQRHYSNRGA